MTAATTRRGRWTGTRVTILGLLVATVALVAAALVDPDGAGFGVVSGSLLLLSAGLVWKLGLAAHVWAAVLGAWLLWTFAGSPIVDRLWYEEVGFPTSVGIILIDVVGVTGGVITLVGVVQYLRTRRRSSAKGRSPGAAASPWGPYHVLAGVAVAVQLVLLSRSFFMGLGWGGLGYVANLGQIVAIVVLALAWFRKHPLRVLPLVLASFLLTQVLLAVDPSLKTRECTPSELAAVAEFPPPPGSPEPDFQSEPDNGCTARFHVDLRGEQLLEHYEQAAKAAGWEVDDPGMVELDNGKIVPAETIDIHSRSHSMSNDKMRLELSFEREGTGSPQRLWVVLNLHERIR